MRLAAAAGLLVTAAAAVPAAVEEDVRCLSTAGAKKVQLEWHTFSESGGDWFGGYVRYRNASRIIPIVPAGTRVLARPDGRTWEFRYRWLEIANGQVSGRYELSSQGANVYDFAYKNLRNSATFSFAEVRSPDDDGKCRWE